MSNVKLMTNYNFILLDYSCRFRHNIRIERKKSLNSVESEARRKEKEGTENHENKEACGAYCCVINVKCTYIIIYIPNMNETQILLIIFQNGYCSQCARCALALCL